VTNRPRYFRKLKDLLGQRFPIDPVMHKLHIDEDKGGAPGLDTTRAVMQVGVA